MSYDSLISLIEENLELNEEIFSSNEFTFLLSCRNGNLDIINWIINFDHKINFSIYNSLPFYLVCENNHLHIAKFIYQTNPNINIDKYFFNILLILCEEDFFELIEWLYSVYYDKFYELSHLKKYMLFKITYDNMNLNMMQWLFCILPSIPIYLNNDNLFITACQNNNIEIAMLLKNMRSKGYYLSVHDNNIIHYEIFKSLIIEQNINKSDLLHHETCNICYEESNIYTGCKHFFCFDCLEKHYETNNYKCPYCRQLNYEDKLFNILNK